MLFALVALGPGADPKPTLVARYRQFNEAAARNDGAKMVAWYQRFAAPSFRYTSKDGNGFDRPAFLKGLRDQAKTIQKPLKSLLTVKRVEVNGKTAVATVATEFEGLIRFDQATLRLVDKSTTRDTWTLTKGDWRLTRSVQTQADTQMFEK
jgi:predicted lipid-binding transport protein (Tim44 family)